MVGSELLIIVTTMVIVSSEVPCGRGGGREVEAKATAFQQAHKLTLCTSPTQVKPKCELLIILM